MKFAHMIGENHGNVLPGCLALHKDTSKIMLPCVMTKRYVHKEYVGAMTEVSNDFAYWSLGKAWIHACVSVIRIS